MKESAKRIDGYLVLALLLSMVAALPLLIGPGIINTRAGGDSLFLVQRVHQLAQDLRAGAFPARWMPEAAYGLGYPAFNYYAAFPYYLAAVLDLAGLGVLWGIKLTQALGFAGAGLMSYLLARRVTGSRQAGLLASVVYTFAPFHLVNVYVRGDSLAEFYAFALYPLIIWALLRLRERRSPENLALLAGSYALLVLSHNISALIFSPFLGVWLLVEAFAGARSEGWRTLLFGVAALVLGLVLSLWYWLPALGEASLVQLAEQTTGYLNYGGHFRNVNLVQARLVHEYVVSGNRDPFNMGLLQAALSLVGLATLALRVLKHKPVSRSCVVAAFVFVVSTWLITPASKGVWTHLPLLSYAQFPWRFLSVQAMAVSLLVTNIPALVEGRMAPLLVLAVGLAAAFAGMAGIPVDRLPLQESEITPRRLMLYETYSGNIGATIRHEYLPREMVPRPFTSAVQLSGGSKPGPLALEGRLVQAQLLHRAADDETWDIEVAEPSLLAFHTTCFPGWRAEVDGLPQDVEGLEGLGLVGLTLAAGAHRVRLQLGSTPLRLYASWGSLAGWVFWMALALCPCRRSKAYRMGAGAVAIVSAILLLWLVLAPVPGNPVRAEGPEVMDYARAPYLHREPEGIFFEQVRLRDYTLAPTRLGPGEVVEITFDWEGIQPTCRVRIKLVGATSHLFDHQPVWTEVSTDILGSPQTVELPLPDDIPPGLYLLDLRVVVDGKERAPRTASGQEIDDLALEPIQVVMGRTATGREPVLGEFGPEDALPVISLVDAEVYLVRDRRLEASLTWRGERQAQANYALSLRLDRANGDRVVTADVPPLLGGFPTSLWPPGELITDRVPLVLPETEEVRGEYVLEVVLYDRMTLKAIGMATLRGIRIEMTPADTM